MIAISNKYTKENAMNVNLDYYKIFYYVAKYENITRTVSLMLQEQ